jgi:RHS repeat-associated protein
VVTFNGAVKQTDYAGEFIYENDVLQFVSHEEGRIVISTQQLVYENHGEATTDFTASNATLAAVTQNGTEKYVRVTSNGTAARTGVFPVGGTFPVVAGEKYRVRVKGYRAGANPAYIAIKVNGTDQSWPGATLPNGVTGEAWTEQVVTIPTGGTTMQVGVTWNTTVTLNEILYVNELDITKLSTGTPEYQYHLKDHLGNVRTTFTTVTPTDQITATLEAANLNTEQSQFLRIATAKRVNATIFDKTNGAATGYSERLNGSANEKYGVAKSLSVMPGDVINAQVYGKYVDSNTSNWTGALTTLMNQIAANTAGVVVDGASYASSTSSFPFAGLQSTSGSTGGPKAYLNWLIFDRNYVLLNGGYTRMSATPKEQGQDVAHELMASPTITITQPGYIYIYLSNEETSPVEVYFDDFRVTNTKSAVVQMDDYYPFGLSISGLSYQRENSAPQDFKYNGKELQDELGLGWLDYGARMYMPEIGRWTSVDLKAEEYFGFSPYNYVANIPTRLVDPNGMEIDWDVKDKKERKELKQEIRKLKQSSETFKTEWKQLKKSDKTYTITANKNVNLFLSMGEKKSGMFVESSKGGGSILLNTEVLKKNEGSILEQTIAEETTHAVQSDDGSQAGTLDKEFEAKVITGVILTEAKLYEGARIDPVNFVPMEMGNSLARGHQRNYQSGFGLFLGIVDKYGGYNGNTSQTPGAVTKDDPKLLNRLVKK